MYVVLIWIIWFIFFCITSYNLLVVFKYELLCCFCLFLRLLSPVVFLIDWVLRFQLNTLLSCLFLFFLGIDIFVVTLVCVAHFIFLSTATPLDLDIITLL